MSLEKNTKPESSLSKKFESASLFQNLGNFGDALQIYQSMLEEQPLNPLANYNAGIICQKTGEFGQAITFFQNAIRSNPKVEKFWTTLIEFTLQLRLYDQAEKYCKQAKLFPLNQKHILKLQQNIISNRDYNQNVSNLKNSVYLDFPAHVHLETFAKCNASCNFCPYPQLDRIGEKMGDELIQKIISDLEEIPKNVPFQLSPFKVNEPFLDTRLFDILDMIQNRLPNASVTLTSNASPITEKKIKQLNRLNNINYLWISFNDHRHEYYEDIMKLSYDRTIAKLNLIHKAKERGGLNFKIVVSRVGNDTQDDVDFIHWVNSKYPLFETSIFSRGHWIGQVETEDIYPVQNLPCVRWFDVSITATGVIAHCCMDGKAQYPIGDVKKQHILEIYNDPKYRRLRESTYSRLDVEPCNSCSFL